MPDKPNIILITCHDLGQHIGCYGIETVRTPNIDRLAAEGVRFENSFCTAPQCSPSRASMVTGRYPHANGIMGLCHADFHWDLYDDEIHLARRLGNRGYHTALIGIIHETDHPERMGFDEIYRRADDQPHVAPAMRLASKAAGWLGSRASESTAPFYLQLGFLEPHRAHQTPTQWPPTHRPAENGATIPPYLRDNEGAAEEMAYFEASVRTADDAVGVVLQALDAGGLADNTLVIFTADHGIPFPRAKCTLYDPGLEVPLIMRWPAGPWQAGAVLDAMVSNVDYVPTLCDLLGLPEPEHCHGTSFAPLLTGGTFTPREELFAEMTYHDYYDPIRAVRSRTHKLLVSFCCNKAIMDPTQQWWHKTAPVVPAKPHATRHGLVELYDLRSDPLEFVNVADDPAQAGVRDAMLRRLHDWMVGTGDPLLDGVPASPRHDEALAMLRRAAR